MKKLGRTNFALVVGGIKDFGTYNPKVIACAFEEALLADEADEVLNFLAWVHEDEENRKFGSGNYEARFREFKLNGKITGKVKQIKKEWETPKMDFSFWKDNKIDQHYLLAREELKTKFLGWMSNQKKEWLDYYSNIDVLVAAFVGQKDGLNSVGNMDKDADGKSEFDYLCEELKPTRNEYFYTQGIWSRPVDSAADEQDSIMLNKFKK